VTLGYGVELVFASHRSSALCTRSGGCFPGGAPSATRTRDLLLRRSFQLTYDLLRSWSLLARWSGRGRERP
jgi:hypothetical protein